jgi:SAM-dependent methyltransferase
VRPDDPAYPRRANTEASFWEHFEFDDGLLAVMRTRQPRINQALTGDPERDWMDDLLGRGPFRDAAMLGCAEGGYERRWLDAGGSRRLDIYDLSPGVLRKFRERLGVGRLGKRAGRRVRFVPADLNFVRLPPGTYDVVWSTSCLHHVANLEHLFAEVERALRPGGLFVVHDYVCERHFRYTPARLTRVNTLLQEVPVRYRTGGIAAIEVPARSDLSPFCGVRSPDILPLARERFDVLHEGVDGALFPLFLVLDVPALAREQPALLERLERAEAEAIRDVDGQPSVAYAVFRKRELGSASHPSQKVRRGDVSTIGM